MRRKKAPLRRLGGVATILTLAATTASLAAASGPFAWLVPSAAPAGWKQLALPAGEAVLSMPPSLHRVRSDPGSVSAAQVASNGKYLAYLNATPQEGNETVSGWPHFRVNHLREESASSVHTLAASTSLPFLGARGSCVIDVYVTRVKHHSFHEIACLVKGASKTGSVIVAAAPTSHWAQVATVLQQTVAAYRAR
jgi:hypothetical protein